VGLHLWANYQFRAARAALDKGEVADARAHITNCLNISSGDAEVHLLAARIERRLSEFKAAEKHLQTYKRIRGITDEFQTEWILLRAQAGELAQHENALWNCVQKDHPQSLEILETLAAGFLREARFSAAFTCLNEWLKREPRNVLALEWRGGALEQLQKRNQAVEDYRQVLELAPERWRARLQLARLLMELTYFADAARELEILLATHGEQEHVQLTWGQCLFNQGKTEEAQQVFSKLIAGSKENQPLVFFYLGKLASDPVEAEKWYRKALALQPSHLEARFGLYTCLQQAGRGKEAAAELKVYEKDRRDQIIMRKLYESMERNPNDPIHLSKLGAQLLEKFDNPQGLFLLRRALVLDPENQLAHEVFARYYEKNNQPERAARHRKHLSAGKE
jgi:Tfp pilus assembly protein PilF